MEENKTKQIYTLKQLSKELETNSQTIRRYVRENGLKCYKKGNKLFFLYDEVIAWLKDSNK